MDWPRIALAFALPSIIALATFIVLAVQILLLLFFETRIASAVLDKKPLDFILAMFAVSLSSQYVREIAGPLLAAFYPEDARESTEQSFVFGIAAVSIFHSLVAFHYSISRVTAFKRRSLLVFPEEVYEKDPATVRQLWIKIFCLIGLTSMVLAAVFHSSMYSLTGLHAWSANANVTVLYLLGMAVVAYCMQPIREAILRFPSSLVLIAKINQIIAQNAKPIEVRRSLSTRKSDPISWARKELLHVSRMLERLARQEDSVSGPDAPHPIAAIYRATADEVRQYCSSPKSIEGAIPATLITTLKMTQGFMITGDATWRKQLIKRLQVFDEDGAPRTLKTAPAAGTTLRTATSGARLLDRSLVWLQSRWAAILAVIAIIAFAFGAIDIETLLGVSA
ncbi:hypothetical protein [Actinoplanes couchii]|uniref:Integral membrane protein n=1 Tax=Actinoplanes couchii TaxID=403638 RepID=A0ABQ3XRE7_9ACTN|nr:hypothetical protein [Actinoplanes couchii]MDR6320051.1 hypothetical protein [Actinoplanes couchii]GID61089.1 hypothetical protein Aco03nite_094930 [Actinoplanes couchii]